ncbi:alanine racemase [Daldinia bambusicola]|nr:alanine racemase [Daldinia bambusicola]
MTDTEMKIDPQRAAALVSQIKTVRERIAAVAKGRDVRLVAVSKLKPANDVLALVQQASPPQLHFGENYAQELSQKAELLPRNIQWHFIGGLQSGHCKSLAKIPNLFCVSSIDTEKKAQLLDKYRGEYLSSLASSSSPSNSSSPNPSSSSPNSPPPPPVPVPGRINVHIQVNTSGEPTKSGCAPGPATVSLCRAVRALPNLHLLGLMTIGAIARSIATAVPDDPDAPVNEDFACLREQRDLVAAELGLDPQALELSMGMSEDFEGAIVAGSNEVRVGSTLFGARGPKSEAKIKV